MEGDHVAWKGTRPPAVTNRDEEVYAYLKEHGPTSRNDLAAALGLSRSLTYLSLDRLRAARRAKRCLTEQSAYTVWTVTVDKPCPS